MEIHTVLIFKQCHTAYMTFVTQDRLIDLIAHHCIFVPCDTMKQLSVVQLQTCVVCCDEGKSITYLSQCGILTASLSQRLIWRCFRNLRTTIPIFDCFYGIVVCKVKDIRLFKILYRSVSVELRDDQTAAIDNHFVVVDQSQETCSLMRCALNLAIYR